MKTAISVDDALLRDADEAARMLGVSRSRLFARAIDDFLHGRRLEQLLTQLNRVYAETAQPEEQRLLRGIKARVGRTVRDRW